MILIENDSHCCGFEVAWEWLMRGRSANNQSIPQIWKVLSGHLMAKRKMLARSNGLDGVGGKFRWRGNFWTKLQEFWDEASSASQCSLANGRKGGWILFIQQPLRRITKIFAGKSQERKFDDVDIDICQEIYSCKVVLCDIPPPGPIVNSQRHPSLHQLNFLPCFFAAFPWVPSDDPQVRVI